MPKLDGLVVDLALNSASMRSGLDSAKSSLGNFGKGVEKAFEGVEKMAKGIKRASNEISQAGLGLAAVASGAVAIAAGVDKGIAREVKNLKDAFSDLAVPIAKMVVPAIRDFATVVREVADWIAGLSPHTKAMIANFLQVAAVVGGAALVVSKVASAVGALAAVFGAISAAPFVAVIAGIAAVAAGALFLHKVWRENWGGIQEKTRDVIGAISGYWAAFRDWLGGLWDGLIDSYGRLMKFVMTGTVELLVAAGKVSRGQGDQQIWAIGKGVDIAMNALKNGALKTAALDFGSKIKDGVLDAAGALKKELDLIMSGFSLGNGGRAARHGGAPASAPSSGHDAIADLSMAAAQTKIDTAAAFLADSIKVNSKYLDTQFKLSAQMRGKAEMGIVQQLEEARKKQREAWDELQRDIQLNGIKLGEALQSQGQHIASKFGALGSIISAGVQGMQNGGPWGAVIGVILELLSNLAGPMRVVGHLMEILGRGLNRLDRVLTPIVEIFGTIADTIEFLTEALESIFDPIQYLSIIFEAIGKTVTGTQLALMLFWRAIMEGTGQNTSAITKQINEIEAKMKHWSFDPKPAKDLQDGLGTLAVAVEKTADRFDELLTNMPSGYKGLKGAQFAADGSVGGPAGRGAEGGIGGWAGGWWGDVLGTSYKDAQGTPVTDNNMFGNWGAGDGPAANSTPNITSDQFGLGGQGVDINFNGPVTFTSTATSLRELAKAIRDQTALDLKGSGRVPP